MALLQEVALHTGHVFEFVDSLCLRVLCHVHIRALRCFVGTLAGPIAGMVAVQEVTVVLQCMVVLLVLRMPSGAAPYHRVTVPCMVGLTCTVAAVLVDMACRHCLHIRASSAR